MVFVTSSGGTRSWLFNNEAAAKMVKGCFCYPGTTAFLAVFCGMQFESRFVTAEVQVFQGHHCNGRSSEVTRPQLVCENDINLWASDSVGCICVVLVIYVCGPMTVSPLFVSNHQKCLSQQRQYPSISAQLGTLGQAGPQRCHLLFLEVNVSVHCMLYGACSCGISMIACCCINGLN